MSGPSSVCVSFAQFFFFKQKTAYEMRISDWSSDVCSSDLNLLPHPEEARQRRLEGWATGLGALFSTLLALHRKPPRAAARELQVGFTEEDEQPGDRKSVV